MFLNESVLKDLDSNLDLIEENILFIQSVIDEEKYLKYKILINKICITLKGRFIRIQIRIANLEELKIRFDNCRVSFGNILIN